MAKKDTKQKQKQKQKQSQTVVVNIGTARRRAPARKAPAKKSSGGSSAPPPPPSHYAPAFFTYPIYQPGVNVPTAQPVSEARTLGTEAPQLRVTPATLASATEARLKLLEKSQKKVEPQDEGISFMEKLQQRRGVFVQPNYEKMQKPAAPSPISEMEQAAEEHLTLPPYIFRGYPEASKGKESPYSAAKRMEEEQAIISEKAPMEEGAKLSLQPPEHIPEIRVGKTITIPTSKIKEAHRQEYRKRYGTEVPSYMSETTSSRGQVGDPDRAIGLGNFLKKNLPAPPPSVKTAQEFDEWYKSLGSQKSGK